MEARTVILQRLTKYDYALIGKDSVAILAHLFCDSLLDVFGSDAHDMATNLKIGERREVELAMGDEPGALDEFANAAGALRECRCEQFCGCGAAFDKAQARLNLA